MHSGRAIPPPSSRIRLCRAETFTLTKAMRALLCLLVAAAGQSAALAESANRTEWVDLFAADLSNAENPDGVWTVSNGVLTASRDAAIWTTRSYDNFVLDLEFKNGPAANSGVIVYCSDIQNWIPSSVEIQILDDAAEEWAEVPGTWKCGAIFGHLAPATNAVKEAGEWNRYTITCIDRTIDVALNGEHVTSMDMSRWTSNQTNPNGSEIPEWLSTPLADLPTNGKIGFQGKHGGAPIWFRGIRIKELD